MHKTFKSTEIHNRELKVDVLFGSPRLLITDFDGDDKGFVIEKSDAPALALAILESAGGRYALGVDVSNAMIDLREYLTEQERAKAEAKDKAKLKAEALELVNAWRESGNCTLLTNWDTLNGTSVGDHWLAVARKARELTKENYEKTMTSKTFNYEGEEIQITGLPESKAISIYMIDSDEDEAQIDIPVTDGPALMQAIAECLPPLPNFVRDGSYEAYMAVVVEYLGKAVRALESEASEAKEQSKLEAEALGYWKAFHSVMGQGIADEVQWTDLMPETQTKWLAVARKAREVIKEEDTND